MSRPHVGQRLADAVTLRLRDLGFERLSSDAPSDSGVDFIVTPIAASTPRFGVLISAGRVTSTQVMQARHRADDLIASGGVAQVIVAVPSATPAVSARLTSAGLGVIDAAGNADFGGPGVRILVTGAGADADIMDARSRERASGWATRPTGLRVLFALLTCPSLVEGRQSDIAEAAGVSIATVHHALRDLDERGILDASSRARVWLDEEAARSLWLDTYTAIVAPTMPGRQLGYVDTCNLPPREWADLLRETDVPGWVSGVAALDTLGLDLVADSTTVYVPDPRAFPRLHRATLEDRVRLTLPPPTGEPTVLLREAWWHPSVYPIGLAPNLLLAADALTSGDPRVARLAKEVLGS